VNYPKPTKVKVVDVPLPSHIEFGEYSDSEQEEFSDVITNLMKEANALREQVSELAARLKDEQAKYRHVVEFSTELIARLTEP
jgi:hypothetical protein